MEWEEGQVGGAGKTSHIGPPGCAPFSRLLGPRIPGQRGQPSHPCLRLRASSEAGPLQSSGAENLGFLRAGCRGQRKSEGSRSVQDARRQGWDPAPDLGAQSGDQRGCSLPDSSGLPPRDPATAPLLASGFLPADPTSFFPLASQGSSVQGVVPLFSQPWADRQKERCQSSFSPLHCHSIFLDQGWGHTS